MRVPHLFFFLINSEKEESISCQFESFVLYITAEEHDFKNESVGISRLLGISHFLKHTF